MYARLMFKDIKKEWQHDTKPLKKNKKRLNMELDLQSLFGLLQCTAVLIG
jgi:hypothetical protein